MSDALQTAERSLGLVVVSPHLDDGVLSLGAAMASWVRRGHRVTLLTVLACDRDSEAEAGGWDRRGGFETEAEAARVRREEDLKACAAIGASPLWFPYGSSDYERKGTDDEVWSAIAGVLDAADVVIGPGSPLTHPDHGWLAELLTVRFGPERVGLYAEQPYTSRDGSHPFERVDVSARDRLAKWRAVRAYRSQLPLLALSAVRGVASLARADERVAWPPAALGSAS